MEDYLPIKGHKDFVRDLKTGMIMNINKNKIRRQEILLNEKRKEREEIEGLKSDVQEIKAMLQQLLENGTNG
jgi:hypothetical protein